jgi:hypothetical protein
MGFSTYIIYTLGLNIRWLDCWCYIASKIYTECKWNVQTNSGHELQIPKQEKISMWTCVRKHLICELWLKEYCVDINSSSALMCGQESLANVWQARMFCHLGLHTNITETSSYMIYQSYWKMCHWQSEHECDFINAARDVLNNAYHGWWRGTKEPIAWPPCSPDLNPLGFYLLGHLKTFVYAAPVDNEEAIHHRIVGACQTTCNYSSIFE